MRDGIPVIDLADDPLRVAAAIGAACAESGFFQIVGHGVPDAVIDAAWWATRAFFDEPEEVRLSVAMPYPGYPYGYQGFEGETLASSLGDATPPDRKHTFSFGPIVPLDRPLADPDEQWVRSPNQWPPSPPGFRDALEEYDAAMSVLAADLLRAMAVEMGAAPRRTSIAFFHNANWDAVIECLPGLGRPVYEPVSAGRHLMEKFQRTVGG